MCNLSLDSMIMAASQLPDESPIVLPDGSIPFQQVCRVNRSATLTDTMQDPTSLILTYMYFVYVLFIPSLSSFFFLCLFSFGFGARNSKTVDFGESRRRRVIALEFVNGMTLVALWHSPPLIRPPNFTLIHYFFEFLWT